jgi:hypothetical protein
VEQRAFIKLKPYFVKSLTYRNICCFIYHVEMQMMLQGLNRMRDKKVGVHLIHLELCGCLICYPDEALLEDHCAADAVTFAGTTALWEHCMCSKLYDDQMWHMYDYLMGICDECGVDKLLLFCLLETDPNSEETVCWRKFEKVVVGVNPMTEKDKMRVRKQFKQTSPADFVSYLKSTVQSFIKHNFVARWQDEQAALAMSGLDLGTILSHIDYAENYTFQV